MQSLTFEIRRLWLRLKGRCMVQMTSEMTRDGLPLTWRYMTPNWVERQGVKASWWCQSVHAVELTESVNSISRLAQWSADWSVIGQWGPKICGSSWDQ